MAENVVKRVARHAVEPVVDAAGAVKETVAEVAQESEEYSRLTESVEDTMRSRAQERERRRRRTRN